MSLAGKEQNTGFHEWVGNEGHAKEGDYPEGTREPWEGFVGGREATYWEWRW